MKNYLIIISSLFILSGCATVQRSAFDVTTEKLDFNDKSYFILGAEINNAVKPKHHPNMAIILHVETPDAEGKEDRFNILIKKDELLNQKNEPASGYFKGALSPGEYVLKGISGMAKRFPIMGSYFLPLSVPLVLNENEVIYLGKIELTTRDREDGEFRAGPVLPLLDQTVSGFGGNTFDVLIKDDSAYSMPLLKQTFPAIANEDIKVRLLPKFDRSIFDKPSGE